MRVLYAAFFVFVAALMVAEGFAQERLPPRNLFEWSQVAPVVVAGTSLGENGRYVEVQVRETLRGDLPGGEVIRVHLRRANRERDRMLTPKALRLIAGTDYVLLLERVPQRDAEQPPLLRMIRGVKGARELPLEGREAFLQALRRFIEIQDTNSDVLMWDELARMLDATNPTLVSTALEQFIKFRRGAPELALGVQPLLDHPQAEIRAQAARLSEQLLARHGKVIPGLDAFRSSLVARARRDPAVAVRVAATAALGRFGDAQVEEVLAEIAESDPEQQVRYTAEVILLERREDSAAAASPDSGG